MNFEMYRGSLCLWYRVLLIFSQLGYRQGTKLRKVLSKAGKNGEDPFTYDIL